jgi:hypothetical protein
MRIAESDWKTFKKLRLVALERFSQRVLDECQAICTNESMTAHDRYGELYKLIQDRDKEMAAAFDDFRRSTAILCLQLIVFYDLLTDAELSRFTPDVQRIVFRK